MKHFHRPLSSHPPSFITANDVTGYNSNNKLCGKRPQYAPAPVTLTFDLLTLKVVSESRVTWATSVPIFMLDALALSVIATATWLAGWLAGWLGGCLSQPVLYQNDKTYLKTFSTI